MIRIAMGKRLALGTMGALALGLLLALSACVVPAVPPELEQSSKFWNQLTALLEPVELPTMTDHRAFMLPGGLILALHFDNMDLSKAQNLNWVAIGVPGKFSRQDQERIEKQFGPGFTHFHDLMADTHGGQPGAEGVWFVHVSVREFTAPWGTVKPGVDENFMPTQAPVVP